MNVVRLLPYGGERAPAAAVTTCCLPHPGGGLDLAGR
jgi:hypothetical protein